MDPVKKTFEEAFSGYEIPVREDLWKQVKAKRRKPERKMWPLLRIAAAVAVVVVALGLLWHRSQPQESNQQLVVTPHEPAINVLPESENTKPEINKSPALPVQEQIASQPDKKSVRKLDVPTMQKAPKHEQRTATVPRQEMAAKDQEQKLMEGENKTIAVHPDEEIALENNMPQEKNEMAYIDVPNEIIPSPITPKPMMEPKSNQLRSTADVLNELKPVLTDRDKTGPERLLAALERVKPKVVDDLIAFGNRNTEIEITW